MPVSEPEGNRLKCPEFLWCVVEIEVRCLYITYIGEPSRGDPPIQVTSRKPIVYLSLKRGSGVFLGIVLCLYIMWGRD